MSSVNQKNNILQPVNIDDDKLIGMSSQFCDDFVYTAIEKLCPFLDENQFDYQISYVRYKPSTNCVVVYKISDLEKNSENDYYLFSKSYTKSDYVDAKEKVSIKSLDQDSNYIEPICDDKLYMIIYSMTSDDSLVGLSTIIDPRKIRRILYDADDIFSKDKIRISHKRTTYDTIRFKPEKRALIKASTIGTDLSLNKTKSIDVFIKCYSNNRVVEVYQLLKLLYNDRKDSKINVPQPIYLDEEKLFYISNGVSGRSLTNNINNDLSNYIEEIAENLTLIHEIKLDEKNRKENSKVVDEAFLTCNTIIELLPEYRKLCLDMFDQFSPLREETVLAESKLVHGDFYHDQILIDDDKFYFIDFDRFYLGETLIDVANFCAHLIYLNITQEMQNEKKLINKFIKVYRNYSKSEIDPKRLQLWVAFCLFQLAIKPFRVYLPKWDKILVQLLDTVENIINDENRYEYQ